jgi:RNA polymerase sigma factor FliA
MSIQPAIESTAHARRAATAAAYRRAKPRIARIARQLTGRVGRRGGIDQADLMAVGAIGFLQACERFDPERGSFEPFADRWVKGAMLDALRQSDWLSRPQRERIKRLDGASDRLRRTLGRAPRDSEIAAEEGLAIHQVRESASLGAMAPLSLDSPVEGGVADGVRSETPGALESLVRAETMRTVRAALDLLAPDERICVELHELEELPVKAVAERTGLTPERVRDLLHAGRRHLKRNLEMLLED